MWSENETTPISLSGPLNSEIEVCNRIISNEIGILNTEDKKKEAIAFLYALINLSEQISISVAKLITNTNHPKLTDYGHRYRLFSTGRVALASTINPPIQENTKLIQAIFNGSIPDPLYGDWMFFNLLEEEYPQYYRSLWGIDTLSGIKTGIIYGKYEFSPIGFLKARSEGKVLPEHLDHWEKIKQFK